MGSADTAAVRTDSAVLSFVNAGSSAEGDAQLVLLVDIDSAASSLDICAMESASALSMRELTSAANDLMALPLVLRSNHNALDALDAAVSGNARADLFSYASRTVSPRFLAAYRGVLRFAAVIGLAQIQKNADVARATLVGAVSTYNPYRDGYEEGGAQTASGELYDPSGWTAAIQVGLRDQFGGVRYGTLYQPRFALVTSGEKRLIVKINDVGPLRPGRVLDLNERSMRYFDPFLARGLLDDARITLLPGQNWTPGPVGDAYLMDIASVQQQSLPQMSTLQAVPELARLRTQFDHWSGSRMREELRADASFGESN